MKNPEENLGLVMRVQVNKVDIHVPTRDSHMVRHKIKKIKVVAFFYEKIY
jgi:hypothetical protein